MSADQPQVSRYRLIEDYPDVLNYKNGRVRITFRANREKCWMLYAEREDDPTHWVEIMRRPTMAEWSDTRFQGFDVPTG